MRRMILACNVPEILRNCVFFNSPFCDSSHRTFKTLWPKWNKFGHAKKSAFKFNGWMKYSTIHFPPFIFNEQIGLDFDDGSEYGRFSMKHLFPWKSPLLGNLVSYHGNTRMNIRNKMRFCCKYNSFLFLNTANWALMRNIILKIYCILKICRKVDSIEWI